MHRNLKYEFMNKNALCPISFKKIDENVARLNGFLTVIFLIYAVFSNSYLPLIVLLFDFFVRSIEKSKLSPFALLSKFTLTKLNKRPHLINAGPKIFAARIGLLFSVLILIAHIFNLDTLYYSLVIVFGICAFLEAAIGFCVACQIYPFVYRFTYQNKSFSKKINSDFTI